MKKKVPVIVIAAMALCLVLLLISRQNQVKQKTLTAGVSAEDAAEPDAAAEPEDAEEPEDAAEPEVIVDPVLAMVEKVTGSSAKVRVLGSLATARLHAGEVIPGMQLLEQALAIIQGMEDAGTKIGAAEKLSGSLVDFEALEGIAAIQKQLGVLMEEVRSEADPTHSLIANIDRPDGKVRVLAVLADALCQAGDRNQALLIFERAQFIAADIEGAGRLRALSHIASSQVRAGMEEDGLKQFREIFVAVDQVEKKTDRLELLGDLSGAFDEFSAKEGYQEMIDEIAEKFRAIRYQDNPSLRLVDKIEDAGGRVHVLCELAASLAEAGNADQAEVVLAKAGEIAGTIEDGSSLAPALAHMAVAQVKVGQVAQAEASLKGVAETIGKLDGIDARMFALNNVVVAMSKSGNQKQIQWLLAQSIEISGVIQERAAKAVNETVALIDRLKDGEAKALALQQLVAGVAQVEASAKLTELQFHLGFLYHQGRYLEKNPQQAAACYHKAAKQGHARAQVALALMHLGGEVVNPDVMEAFSWFAQAAQQGHAEAQVSLGMMYALGKGVETDFVRAHKWITLAAAQDNGEAKSALGQLNGKLTPGQLEQSADLVKHWHARQSSAADDPIAQKEEEAPAK